MVSIKKLFLFIFFGASICTYAQTRQLQQSMFKDLEVTSSITKSMGDSVLTFHVKALDDDIAAEFDKRYYWFYEGELKSTQGHYSGKLLHGEILKFDRHQNLMAKGEFANGLKDGVWLVYNPNGIVANKTTWQHGWRVGKFEQYYMNGKLYKVVPYRKNLFHGKAYIYSIEGEILGTEEYKEGRLIHASIRQTATDSVQTEKGKKGFWRRKKKNETNVPNSIEAQPQQTDQMPEELRKEKKRSRKEKKAKPPSDSPVQPNQ